MYILEEYIPLKMVYEHRIGTIEYCSYSCGVHSLLEIAAARNSGEVKEITLVLCQCWRIFDSDLSISRDKIRDGVFKMPEVRDRECDVFKAYIYKNGVRFILSAESSLYYAGAADYSLLIGVSAEGEIAEIVAENCSVDVIRHLKEELLFENGDCFQA